MVITETLVRGPPTLEAMGTFWNGTDEVRVMVKPHAFPELSELKLVDRLGFDVYYWGNRWVVDIYHGRYFEAGFLATFDSELQLVNRIQASLCNMLETASADAVRAVLASLCKMQGNFLRVYQHDELEEPEEPEEPPRPSYAVVVSAVVLLAFVYQYLTGNVDRGGSKAYSRSSLDFRDIYVAIVLFLGAYVWIKFREVAFKGVYRRKLKNQGGRVTKVVYEPRFKPPRENGRAFGRIYLGQYATREEASILYQIAAFYYNENQDSFLDLEDGRWFSIPPMREGERSLTGLEKRACVKLLVMKVYEEFKKEKAEAAKLWQEFLEVWDGELPQEQAEGVAVSNGPQEGSAIPVSQLPPNPESGMGISSSNQLDLLQIMNNQQELITYQQQQISLLKQQLQDCRGPNFGI